ncbi:MAG: carotenoid oxygenase family protein, partial [Actinomycetota bacterium]
MAAIGGWHRREFLAAAGAALAVAAGCARGSSGGGDPTVAPPTTGAPPPTAPLDPSQPWWLQGGFAPVEREVEAIDLEVTGALPPELTGLYVRNGSNPRTGTSPHWFFGDGMVHGVRLEAGRAARYRNRYVRTPLYEASAGFGAGAPGGTNSQSNVSAIRLGDRLLTSGEVGLPFELDPADLSTAGAFDFDGALTTSMTAHPKVDPATGRLHFFGYGFVPPYLTYHVASPDGVLLSSTEIPVAGPTMIHDFAITEQDAVFWELPVVFDLEAAMAYIEDPATSAFPFRWEPDFGARVGVLPLGGDGAQVRWADLDEPCYVFHGVNAFRAGDDVVLDVCRMSSMFDPEGEGALGGELTLRRWTVTPGQRVRDEVLVEAARDPGELPSRDPRRVGRAHRHGYLVQNRVRPGTVDLGGVIKHDFTTGRRETWDPGPTRHSGEWPFVPAADEGAGTKSHSPLWRVGPGSQVSRRPVVKAWLMAPPR